MRDLLNNVSVLRSAVIRFSKWSENTDVADYATLLRSFWNFLSLVFLFSSAKMPEEPLSSFLTLNQILFAAYSSKTGAIPSKRLKTKKIACNVTPAGSFQSLMRSPPSVQFQTVCLCTPKDCLRYQTLCRNVGVRRALGGSPIPPHLFLRYSLKCTATEEQLEFKCEDLNRFFIVSSVFILNFKTKGVGSLFRRNARPSRETTDMQRS